MNPINKYYNRFLEIKAEKGITTDSEALQKLILDDPSGLNNYYMAALGMSTLMLRLGAVIQMCQKIERLDDQGDALFLKQILENLRETLPSDTSWKNLWALSALDESWKSPTIKPKNGESLFNRFITFRNRFVHQLIRIEIEFLPQLLNSVTLFDEIAALTSLFDGGSLEFGEGKFQWKQNGHTLILYPYVQPGTSDESPYIFQGLYSNKSKAHLLNLRLGDEVTQDAMEHLEPVFHPIKNALRGGAGQIFDHSDRIAYYQSCFVGRDKEKDAALAFCNASTSDNILCIKSPAGMGKGALLAELIEQLRQDKNQVLYHFCGAGLQNSLHATLYHLMLQGKRLQYWNNADESIQQKLERMPSKYTEVIHLFQALLTDHLNIQKNNTSGNLIIIIDGLDEAQVAFSQLKISDWFYTYNEKEEPETDWRSLSSIRWIFTYRCDDNGEETFYQFPKWKELYSSDELQPLKGLSPEAVNLAFDQFNVSEDFKSAVIQKANIV